MSAANGLWNEVNLLGHNVIEASAGTGKTYTIEHLVLRILTEPPQASLNLDANHEPQPNVLCTDAEGHPRRANMDDLLVVTYTEKATEELKERIRSKLEEKIEELYSAKVLKEQTVSVEHDNLIQHLRDNLAQIDQANIQTIHGFCHSMLQTYAFEAGDSAGSRTVNDQEGLAEELRRQWRLLPKGESEILSQWLAKDKGESEILQMASYLSSDQVVLEGQEGLDKVEALKQLSTKPARTFQTFDDSLKELELKVQAILKNREALEKAGGKDILAYFKKYDKVILAIDLIKKGADRKEIKLGRSRLDTAMGTNAAKTVWAENPGLDEICDLWKSLCQQVDDCAQMTEVEDFVPKASFALKIAEAWKRRKVKSGETSFDDMISRLAKALRLESSLTKKPLHDRLQERFTYGIIDEFQDTDADQCFIFEQIFKQRPSEHSGSLTLVGDPKQAIYSFRGADLFTYLKATESIVSEGGQKLNLNQNFRSTPEMIEAGNVLFMTPGWFDGRFSDPEDTDHGKKKGKTMTSGVHYLQKVECGKTDHKATGASHWLSASTHLCNLSELDENTNGQRAAYSQWLLERIQGIVQGGDGEQPSLFLPLEKPSTEQEPEYRPVELGDIAVLFQTRTETKPLQRLLDEAKIPWREYKQEGVYTSDACFQWVILLEALSEVDDESVPVRKALFGWFFPDRACVSEDGLPSEDIRIRLKKWRLLVERQRWAELLVSVVESSGVEERILTDIGGDREVADLRQIRDAILQHLLLGGEGLADTARWLRRVASGEKLDAEQGLSTIHHLESDSSKITFISMHSSKGLEYPITILMPNFEPRKKDSLAAPCPKTEKGEATQRLFAPYDDDIAETNKALAEHERARLLYVAFTRGVFLQFAPIYSKKSNKEEEPNKLSWPFTALAHVARQSENTSLFKLESPKDSLELSTFSVPKLAPQRDEPETCDDPCKEVSDWQERAQQVMASLRIQTSFSSLQGSTRHSIPDLQTNDRDHNRAQEPEAIEDVGAEPVEMISHLPRDKFTGNFLHEVLELENWSQLAQHETLPKREKDALYKSLDHRLKSHRLAGSDDTQKTALRRSETLSICQNLLTCPIVDAHDDVSFSLLDISTKDRITELEFLMAMDAEGQPLGFDFDQDKERSSGGWLLGFIDLVFRRALPDGSHRYYVLDWKSNSIPQYTKSHIDACMANHHYDLQADIYSHALDHWLSQRLGQSYHREHHFGGAIYAFVRGQQQKPSPEAFWQKSYSEESLKHVGDDIAKRFRHLLHKIQS